MRVCIRADASSQMGSGHLMRCLTLAEGLRDRGATVHFICRSHRGNLCEFLEQRGFSVHRLPVMESTPGIPPLTLHEGWLGASWEADAEQTAAILSELGLVDWLIVDHYALDYQWEARLRPLARRIMVIDDLADRRHDCDLILDQNFYWDMTRRYQDLVPQSCQQLVGPKYALLNRTFSVHQRTPVERNRTVERILVYFGATDPSGETLKALAALERLGAWSLEIDVVVGLSNPRAAEITALADRMEGCRVLSYVEDMAQLMARADLALGASGTTTWERCFKGLPSIVISIAKNQEETASALAEAGYILYLGPHDEVSVDLIHDCLKTILQSNRWRESLAKRCAELVDGRGVRRVLDVLSPPAIELRLAAPQDCEKIYAWRNAEKTRQYFFNPEPVELEAHRRWFQQTLQDPSRALLIGEQQGEAVGVLRYDLQGGTAVVSVYLVPGKHRQGLGASLIRAGSAWVAQHFQVRAIRAEVLEKNVASYEAFLRAGFRRESVTLVNEITGVGL